MLYFVLESNSTDIRYPNTTAAAIPAEVALTPPVTIPNKPFLSTSPITPLAKE